MPIPKPQSGESEHEFISRCMHAIGDEYENDQAVAICYSQWRDKKAPMTQTSTREQLVRAAKTGDPSGLLVRKGLVPESVEPGEGRTVRFVISTGAVDRDNDVINPKGWDLTAYQKNPVVLWAHDYKTLPLGRAKSVEIRDGKLVSEMEFADHPFADTVYQMVKGGFLRATSVGFQPKQFRLNEERQGIDYDQQELMEYSIVPVPANPEALIDFPAAKAAGIDIEPVVKWADAVMKGAGKVVYLSGPHQPAQPIDLDAEHEDPVRWNRSLSKAFDVDGEPAEPSSQYYKWVSRYLDCPVKDLSERWMTASGAMMGAVLLGVDESLAERFKVDAVRNIHGSTEAPPCYETLQLNSRRSRDFLIEGSRFLTPAAGAPIGIKLVVRSIPFWSGVQLAFYSRRADAAGVAELLNAASVKAASYKFLKGEAFSLSGEFLQRGSETWDDLFLTDTVLEPIKRTAVLLAEQGKEMETRGQILMGPPGTGKTLAGRILMNDVKEATFIWCSSRDFYRVGMFGGIEMAYDLAAENAPSIVFIEDIDSWWSDTTVDLLKTELDGLKQKKGIVTVLTTNNPQDLPDALIDRPGRFHDVLNLDLPDEAVRRRMLDQWAPDAPEATRDALAKQTNGLSGAHLRELVRFAETIRAQDDIDLTLALERALAKVQEQRDVITACRRPKKARAVTMFKMAPKPEGSLNETPTSAPPVHAAEVAVCRVCERELPLTMPRIKDEIGLVCAPCFVAARYPTPPDSAVTTAAETPDETFVLDLDDAPSEEVVVELDEDDDAVVDLSPEAVRAALRSAITSTVSTIVRDETRAAFDRARGRVD